MRKPLVVAMLLFIMPAVSFAPGSLETLSLSQLLGQRPELTRPFLATFELEGSATGTRLGPHFMHLGGARIGPYEVMARARGSTDSFNVRVIICTAIEFLDRGGKVTKLESAAVGARESLRGFIIEPER